MKDSYYIQWEVGIEKETDQHRVTEPSEFSFETISPEELCCPQSEASSQFPYLFLTTIFLRFD